MKKILLSGLLLSSLASMNAQQTKKQPKTCASDAINIKLMQDFPASVARMAQFEKTAQMHLASSKKTASSYIIPVVVHVMHKGEPLGTGTNITDEQIKAKIKAINEEYRKIPGSLGYGNGVDVGMEFALATVDPSGQPTSGITRHDMSANADYMQYGIKSSNATGMEDATLKGLAFWNSNYYYNFWIISEIDNNEGGYGIQGYATLAGAHGYSTDGTMVLSNSFKNTDSRTEAHELGHAFNLFHTFEGDNNGDSCPGTGNQAGVGLSDGCSDTAPHNRNDNDCLAITNNCYPDNSDLSFVNNYMSYSYDECQNMFTAEQKNRIISALTNIRNSFLSATATNKLKPAAVPTANFLPLKPVLISAGTTYGLTDISNQVPNTYLSADNWLGMTFNWNVSKNSGAALTSTNQNPVFTFTEPGIYNVSHSVNNGLGNSTKSFDNLIYVNSPIPTLPATTLSSTNNGNYGYTVSYVNFNDIDLTTETVTNNKYSDLSNSAKTLVVAGSSYPLTVTLKSGNQQPEYCSVYIDYNNNGTFEETEKVTSANIPKATALTNFTSTITIPNSAVKNTLLRMRVAGNASADISNAMVNGSASFYCGDTKDFGLYIINSQALKTEEFTANESNLSFYPNPVKDVLNLNNIEAIEKVEIYSISGQLLLSENFQDTNIKIDLSELKSGTYIATVYANGKKSAIKILKN